jgi:hypothetical protein
MSFNVYPGKPLKASGAQSTKPFRKMLGKCLSNYKIMRDLHVAYAKHHMWKFFTNFSPANISGLFAY